ncbi:MAG: hypothetical protein OHK0015_24870 [Chloroflexi bacterium OHK40]
MTIAVYNTTVGHADAGLVARAMFIARASGQGVSLPTFHQLRS